MVTRQEKRLAVKMISYWKKLNTESGLPDIKRFNHRAIEDLWPYCIKIMILDSSEVRMYKYVYMGDEIIKAYGTNLTGQQVSPKIRTIPGGSIIRKLDASIPLNEPAMEQGQFINNDDKLVKYRSCILPFGNRDFKMSHVIIGFSWRMYE